MGLETVSIKIDTEAWQWLLKQPPGASGTIRMLVEDAMGDKSKRKELKGLLERIEVLKTEIADKEAQSAQANLELQKLAEQRALAEASLSERQRIEDARWDKYRETHPMWNAGLDFDAQRELVARVKAGLNPSPPSVEEDAK